MVVLPYATGALDIQVGLPVRRSFQVSMEMRMAQVCLYLPFSPQNFRTEMNVGGSLDRAVSHIIGRDPNQIDSGELNVCHFCWYKDRRTHCIADLGTKRGFKCFENCKIDQPRFPLNICEHILIRSCPLSLLLSILATSITQSITHNLKFLNTGLDRNRGYIP